jgi:signal transduction histidine kinase
MTSIRSFAEILLHAADVPAEERRRFVSIIHEESQRLTRLLDEILDSGRLEAGGLEFAADGSSYFCARLNRVRAQ